MPSSVEYLPDRQTVLVKHTGSLSPDELGRQTAIGIELLKRHGSFRVLVAGEVIGDRPRICQQGSPK